MPESIHDTLERVRRPMVHIKYEVETLGAIEMKEIPFVVGVMADLSGKPDKPLPKLKDKDKRKFVEIDRDNFDKVLAGMKPQLSFMVDNKLTEEDTQMKVALKFNSLDDFHPEHVVKQIKPLNELLNERQRLSNLVDKVESYDKLKDQLLDIIENTDELQKVGEEIGLKETDKEPKKE